MPDHPKIGRGGRRRAELILVCADVPSRHWGSWNPLDVTALSDAPSARRWACQPCIYGAVCGGGRSILIGRRIALAGRRGRTHRQGILDRSVVDDAAVVLILGAGADRRRSCRYSLVVLSNH